jgi:hypothetical protein
VIASLEPTSVPFHWIGSFGRTDSPISAIKRGNEVLTRRAGETISDGYILARVERDSIWVASPGAEQRRLTLDGKAP